MKNALLFIPILFFSVQTSFSQSYGTALGLRFGNSDTNRMIGLTLQQRILDHVTIEGIVQTDFNLNHTASILAERHHSLISKRFNFYYGAGISFGNEESMVKNPATKEIIHTYGNVTSGVDLIGGIELNIASVSISLDYKPNINIAGREEFFKGQVGISARSVLVKGKTQKKNQRQRQRAKSKKAKSQSPKKTFPNPFKRD